MTNPVMAMSLVLASAGLLAAQGSRVDAAWELLAKGQRAQAIAVPREAIRAEPRNGDALLLLGSVLMEEKQAPESIEALKEAVRLKPESSEAHNALGEAYNTFGYPRAARPEFDRAVKIDSRFAQAHVNLAAVLLQSEKAAQAEAHLNRAISLIGRTADAAYPLHLRGKIHLDARAPEKAVPDLGQAVKLRPDFAEAWSDLGEARRNLLDDSGALEAFQRAIELSPEESVGSQQPSNSVAQRRANGAGGRCPAATGGGASRARQKRAEPDDGDGVQRPGSVAGAERRCSWSDREVPCGTSASARPRRNTRPPGDRAAEGRAMG